MRGLVLCLAAWGAAIEGTGRGRPEEDEHLKGIDGSDLASAMPPGGCIWPCELMCLLDLSEAVGSGARSA